MIGIVRTSDNVLEAVIESTDGWSMAGRREVEVPAAYTGSHLSPMTWSPEEGAFVANIPNMRAYLIGRVNVEREARQCALLTSGEAKKHVYAKKALEASNFAIGLTPLEEMPFAAAEAAATGEPIETVLARYAAGAASADTEIARIEAVAQVGITALRDAPDCDAMLHAFMSIQWEKNDG